MTIKEIYKRGFVDGMRNCGFLLYDTHDMDIQLTDEWIKTIDTEFNNHTFPKRFEKYRKLQVELEGTKMAYKTIHEAYYNLLALPRHGHLKE